MNATKLGIYTRNRAGWLTALLVTLLLSGTVNAEGIPTRDGTLSVNADQKLVYKGRLLDTTVEGGLSIVQGHALPKLDLVILRQSGGSGCPAQFYFLAIADTGIKISDALGTCSDKIQVQGTSTNVTIILPGFAGPFESEVARSRAAKEQHFYQYQSDEVTADGKPVQFSSVALKEQATPARSPSAGATASTEDPRQRLARLANKHASAVKALGFSKAFLNGTIYLQPDAVNQPVAYVKFGDWLAMLFESGNYSNITKINSGQAQGVLLKRPGIPSGGILFALDGGEIFPSHTVQNGQAERLETINQQLFVTMMVTQSTK